MEGERRFLVRCRVSRGFFDGEFLVMVAGSSAYVNGRNVRTEADPTKGEVEGLVSAYVIQTEGDRALIELPGQAVVGGVRTWVPRHLLSTATA
jgi:hypothetical protein